MNSIVNWVIYPIQVFFYGIWVVTAYTVYACWYPFTYIPVIASGLWWMFLTPIALALEVLFHSLLLPLKPVMYILGIQPNKFAAGFLNNFEFFAVTLYQYLAVAILFGSIVGVITGVILSGISYLMTPSASKILKYDEKLDEKLVKQLLSNIPKENGPLPTGLKIDIKYDTSPSPPHIHVVDNKEFSGDNTTTGIDLYKNSLALTHRSESEPDTISTLNELFTVRTEESELTERKSIKSRKVK